MVSSASKGLSSTSRISICSNASIGLLPWQGEIESCPFAGLALGPHAAAMARHDPMHQRESDAGSLKLGHVMQALKDPEQLCLIARVETGAVVADKINMFLIVCDRTDFDDRLFPLAGKLQRVGKEIGPHLLEQHAVCCGVRQRPESKLGLRVLVLSGQSLVRRSCQLSHVELRHP